EPDRRTICTTIPGNGRRHKTFVLGDDGGHEHSIGLLDVAAPLIDQARRHIELPSNFGNHSAWRERRHHNLLTLRRAPATSTLRARNNRHMHYAALLTASL